MASPIDDRPTDPRPGAAGDRTGRVDDATVRPNARTSVRDSEVKRHRGGSTLWIVLAVVLALLLALWLFSGLFGADPEVGTDVDVVPGAAVDGAVTNVDPVVPDGTTIDGAPVTDGVATDGVVVDGAVTGN